jgi:hypothetical protein
MFRLGQECKDHTKLPQINSNMVTVSRAAYLVRIIHKEIDDSYYITHLNISEAKTV